MTLPNYMYVILGMLSVLIILLIVTAIKRYITQEPQTVPVTPEVYEKERQKIDRLISGWINEEIQRTSVVIETTGFKYTFLGQIANINFKALGILDEVETELKRQLHDTEEIRSFSHFLDLVRILYEEVDTAVISILQTRYFTGLTGVTLGPTAYTHNRKQLEYLESHYPWLWILELIANSPKVQNYTAGTTSVVTVDKSEQMQRGIHLPHEVTHLQSPGLYDTARD